MDIFSILILESDPETENKLQAAAERLNCRWKTTPNDLVAMDIMGKGEADLIIADRQLPRVRATNLHEPKNGAWHGPWILYSDCLHLEMTARNMAHSKNHGILLKNEISVDCAPFVFELLASRLQIEMRSRQQFQEQWIKQDKMIMMGQMVAGLVHELNNPLSFVSSNLHNLNKFTCRLFEIIDYVDQLDIPVATRNDFDKKKGEVGYHYLQERVPEMITASTHGAERMKSLIMDLKLFSRSNGEKPAPVDVNAMIDSVLNVLHHGYKDRINIVKKYELLPPVECYAGKVEQIVINLLVNACQAIEGKGKILIATRLDGDRVTIAIGDNGCGMSEAVKARIFDPFYTTKPVGIGTGLGLPICAEIVKQHGGSLTVASELGEGTTFTLVLPVHFLGSELTVNMGG